MEFELTYFEAAVLHFSHHSTDNLHPDLITHLISTIIITLLLVVFFLTCVGWGSFTGVWVAASLLKSLELLAVFWPILARLWMVSAHPSISNCSSPPLLPKAFEYRSECTNKYWYHRHLYVPKLSFISLASPSNHYFTPLRVFHTNISWWSSTAWKQIPSSFRNF